MANVGQVYYNVVDDTRNGYATYPDGLNIFKDLVSAYGANRFNKIGIQAPPGTRVIMNENKTIMVGRTGIYELDEDIVITALRFDRPRRYVKDEAASADAIQAGIAGMLEAEETRKTAINDLNTRYPDVPTNETDPNYAVYWDEYNTIQTNYIKAYEAALGQFNTGTNGIFIQPNPSDPDAKENYQDLYNVIVDFIYE